jgi:hypothetical protein
VVRLFQKLLEDEEAEEVFREFIVPAQHRQESGQSRGKNTGNRLAGQITMQIVQDKAFEPIKV